MAARDIMPFTSPFGGTTEVRYGEFTAGELFEVGEPVAAVAAGTWTEPPDDATQFILAGDIGGNMEIGIAAWGPGGGNLNPTTGLAYATGDWFPYYPVGENQLWITDNFFDAGAGSVVAPDLTDIGNDWQIVYSTTAGIIGWGIERTIALEGVDVIATIVDVLDALKRPIRITGAAGVHVVFKIRQPTLTKL